MNHNDPALERIVAGILMVAKPEKIILFGSRARGDHKADSDYDVLVVSRPEERKSYLALVRSIGAVHPGLDLVMATPEELERWRGAPVHVLGDAQAEGQVLYP